MENPYNLISELLENINNRRTQEVLRRRFGLVDGQLQTLQQIGDEYNITRERVRQIEKNGLDHLSKPEIAERLKPFEDDIYNYFKNYGELRRESSLFDDLVCYCVPAKLVRSGQTPNQVEQMAKSAKSENELCRSAINLILTLGEPFTRFPETDEFYPFWTVNKNSVGRAKKTVDSAIKYFSKNKQVLKQQELSSAIKKNLSGIDDNAIFSYIDASKIIEKNNFDEFGLIDWPEISPRGVRDKAYLILKKEGKPFHFTEVTDLINQYLPDSRPAYVQTVHNELIKDGRFVLIGRGIYALSEWGYQPGTVVDVIRQILKDKGPLSKEEIIKEVMAKRLIKETTILINLQNRKFFKRLPDGRFAV